MSNKRIAVSMKPNCQRILTTVYSKEILTTKELASILSDIPQATLYRYVRLLIEVGALEVVKEEQKRGGIERTIKLTKNPKGTFDEISTAIMYLHDSFRKYFEQEQPEPIKDLLAVSGVSLMLDDEEYLNLLGEINKLIESAINKEKKENQKQRNLYVISAPVLEEL